MKRILAAFIFFTRLPLWRLADIDKRYYERVVPLWPMVGWLTGGVMTLVCWAALQVLPAGVAVVLALLARILLTGALHEDGFADFCDGFGGGTTRERILQIMKDSHIGTYGVLGLLGYLLLMYNVTTALAGLCGLPLFFLIGDTLCKYLSSWITTFLPYARKESEAKSRLIYAEIPVQERLLSVALAIFPLLLCWPWCSAALLWGFLVATLTALLCAGLMFRLMKRGIQGYTGDCCGATFVVTETVFYLTLLVCLSL